MDGDAIDGRDEPAAAALRRGIKRGLAAVRSRQVAGGTTILIYHRVGGGTPDERDLATEAFRRQVELLAHHNVVSLDAALDELDAGEDRPKVVLTFDDGFGDVHERAWPILRDAGLPFTVYVATAYVGGSMHWDGSTASAPGPGLDWDQLAELEASPLVTLGNHTHSHARPEQLTADELDRCSDELSSRLGVDPDHFAFTWGVPVPQADPLLRQRFRSSVTGQLGRNHLDTDRHRLHRVPVRATDPRSFFAAKLTGGLGPERAYDRIVSTAKRLGVPA